MAIHSVTYDLNNPGQNYSRLTGRLSAYDSHKAQYSQWLVHTDLSEVELRNDLTGYVDANDKLAVMEMIKGGWAFRNMRSTADWLEARGY